MAGKGVKRKKGKQVKPEKGISAEAIPDAAKRRLLRSIEDALPYYSYDYGEKTRLGNGALTERIDSCAKEIIREVERGDAADSAYSGLAAWYGALDIPERTLAHEVADRIAPALGDSWARTGYTSLSQLEEALSTHLSEVNEKEKEASAAAGKKKWSLRWPGAALRHRGARARLEEARILRKKASLLGENGAVMIKALTREEERAMASETPSEAAHAIVEAYARSIGEHLRQQAAADDIAAALKAWLVSSGSIRKDANSCKGEWKLNLIKMVGYLNAEVCSAGFDMAAVESLEGKVYRCGTGAGAQGLRPRKMRERCVRDYLAYCREHAQPGNEKEHRKIEFAAAILTGNMAVAVADYASALSKTAKASLEELFGASAASLPQEGTFPTTKLSILLDGDKEKRKALEHIAYRELKLFLQSKKTDARRESLELVLERFRPEVYEKAFRESARKGHGSLFELAPTRDPHLAKRAAKATWSTRWDRGDGDEDDDGYDGGWGTDDGSCIADNSLRGFRRVLADLGTVYMAASLDGKLAGYVRLFLMRDSKGAPVLAVDTMEPPRKDFETYEGLINAMALAAVQLGLDIGARTVVGDDSRIKYGPRQAFGNKQKNLHLTKAGAKPMTVYSIYDDGTWDSNPYVLMERWW